ncbi:MAG: helix-turn-helix transcriptional regulator [Gammaproteobacteria bacterium]|nr:helix-turn-helix transcriptional regulator [Gammaproteobacteria bacterium]
MTTNRNVISRQPTAPTPIAGTTPQVTSKPDILSLVGERVRGLRAQRGMTRKMLARDSSVSERYLAQLERGQGNISISLLLKVATALHTTLAQLVRIENSETVEQTLIDDFVRHMTPGDQQRALNLLYEHFSAVNRKHRRIALIGMRGAGKTTLGRRLAEHHDLPFVQLVAQIEELAGMSVPEILALTGRNGYRRFEEQALQEALTENEFCILETGGGIVSDPRMLNIILSSCFVIWIQATPDEHMRRVIDQGDLRPMQANADAMDDLKQILEERTPFYEKAHARLNTTGRDVEECFRELVDIVVVDKE